MATTNLHIAKIASESDVLLFQTKRIRAKCSTLGHHCTDIISWMETCSTTTTPHRSLQLNFKQEKTVDKIQHSTQPHWPSAHSQSPQSSTGWSRKKLHKV